MATRMDAPGTRFDAPVPIEVRDPRPLVDADTVLEELCGWRPSASRAGWTVAFRR